MFSNAKVRDLQRRTFIRFGSYLTENIVYLHYKEQLIFLWEFSRCLYSLSVPVVLIHSYASVSHSRPHSQLPNRHDPLLRLILRILGLAKSAYLPNFKKIIECVFLMMVVLHLQDIFSIALPIFRLV